MRKKKSGSNHKKKSKDWRQCLGCSRRFVSNGPWHRLCSKCRQGQGLSPFDEEYYY